MSGQANPVSYIMALYNYRLERNLFTWGSVVIIILAATESSTERKLTTIRRELADFLPRDQFSEI